MNTFIEDILNVEPIVEPFIDQIIVEKVSYHGSRDSPECLLYYLHGIDAVNKIQDVLQIFVVKDKIIELEYRNCVTEKFLSVYSNYSYFVLSACTNHHFCDCLFHLGVIKQNNLSNFSKTGLIRILEDVLKIRSAHKEIEIVIQNSCHIILV